MKFPRDRFLIGAYFYDDTLYEDKYMKDASDMGIDFLVQTGAEKKFLDLCEKYGIGVLATKILPRWWGSDGSNAGGYEKTMSNEVMLNAKSTYPDSSALWGDYLVDEPSSKYFDGITRVVKEYEKIFPGQFPYINLYPNYASVAQNTKEQAISQLGNATYAEHIDEYLKKVDLDYLCFDYYPFQGSNCGTFDMYLENLDIAAKACRKSGRDLWLIIQTGAWLTTQNLKEFQLRWQAFLSLAYGSTVIMHATYCKGWWTEETGCVNSDGSKNPVYYYAKRLNADLHALGERLFLYRSTGITVHGDIENAHPRLASQLMRQKNSPDHGIISNISITADGAVLAGHFTNKDSGTPAVLIVNMKDAFDENAKVCGTVTLGEKTFDFELPSGEGKLFEF